MTDNYMDYWEKANVLRGEAEYQDFKYGSANYEWEMGMEVADYFRNSFSWINIKDDSPKEFMGIPIRVNFSNPQCLKLWREIN